MSEEEPSEEVRRAELQRIQADDDLRSQLGNVQGRRQLWRLIDERSGVGLLGVTFCGDALRSAYLEGRRSIGVELYAECQRVSPSDSVLMLKEASERRLEATRDGR